MRKGGRGAELLYDGSHRESKEMKLESHIVGRTAYPFVG